jgi:phosphohistidine phosphatase SixA
MRALVLLFAALLLPSVADANERLWELLRTGGQVVLLRHTETTPGSGDPSGFRIDDCSTQRNLSPQGRVQAQRIGQALRERGVRIGEVLSSRWCRALDTAQLAFGRHQVWPELNSTYDNPTGRDQQAQAVRQRIAAYRGADNLFLVGHGSNILTLTGIHPSQGGMVVVTPGGANGFVIAGRLEPEAILSGQPGRR